MAEVPTVNGSFLTQKAGPLPVWLWGTIGLVGAYLVFKHNQAKNPTPASTASTSTTDSTGDNTVPDYVSQTYTTVTNNIPPTGPATPAPVPTTPSGPTAPPVAKPPAPPVVSKPIPGKPPTPPVKKAAPIAYKVKKGDTLSSIAKAHGYGADWQAIWNFNISSAGGRPASTIATLKQRGPNTLFSGETILIPPK